MPTNQRVWLDDCEEMTPGDDEPRQGQQSDSCRIIRATRPDLPLQVRGQLLTEHQVLRGELGTGSNTADMREMRSSATRQIVRMKVRDWLVMRRIVRELFVRRQRPPRVHRTEFLADHGALRSPLVVTMNVPVQH